MVSAVKLSKAHTYVSQRLLSYVSNPNQDRFQFEKVFQLAPWRSVVFAGAPISSITTSLIFKFQSGQISVWKRFLVGFPKVGGFRRGTCFFHHPWIDCPDTSLTSCLRPISLLLDSTLIYKTISCHTIVFFLWSDAKYHQGNLITWKKNVEKF